MEGTHLVRLVSMRMVVRVPLHTEDNAVGEEPVGVPGVVHPNLLVPVGSAPVGQTFLNAGSRLVVYKIKGTLSAEITTLGLVIIHGSMMPHGDDVLTDRLVNVTFADHNALCS